MFHASISHAVHGHVPEPPDAPSVSDAPDAASKPITSEHHICLVGVRGVKLLMPFVPVYSLTGQLFNTFFFGPHVICANTYTSLDEKLFTDVPALMPFTAFTRRAGKHLIRNKEQVIAVMANNLVYVETIAALVAASVDTTFKENILELLHQYNIDGPTESHIYPVVAEWNPETAAEYHTWFMAATSNLSIYELVDPRHVRDDYPYKKFGGMLDSGRNNTPNPIKELSELVM